MLLVVLVCCWLVALARGLRVELPDGTLVASLALDPPALLEWRGDSVDWSVAQQLRAGAHSVTVEGCVCVAPQRVEHDVQLVGAHGMAWRTRCGREAGARVAAAPVAALSWVPRAPLRAPPPLPPLAPERSWLARYWWALALGGFAAAQLLGR